MKDDPYWEEGTYKKELLEAGQYEKKQYIVPLSCYYPVLIGGQGAEEMRGETLAEWIEQMKGSDDEGLQQAARSLRLWTGGRWFEPAVDYEKQEVLFDQEKWTGFAADYLELEEVYRDSGTDSGDLKYNIEYISLQTEQNGIRFLQNIPDINGKKTATVKGYAAIGMSGDHKKEAYDFMMLFLNQGITDKNAREGQQEHALGRIDESGFPVQERAIGSDGERTMTLETFRQIDGAYFITDVERMLYTSLEEAAYSMYEPGFDAEAGWEAVVSPIADKAWNDYKVQMSE